MCTILSQSRHSCIALHPSGGIHLSIGQLFFQFKRSEMLEFLYTLVKAFDEMKITHGYNKIFFETGIQSLKICLCKEEVEDLIDCVNEAELALSLRELLE
jgi:hypothetical protein